MEEYLKIKILKLKVYITSKHVDRLHRYMLIIANPIFIGTDEADRYEKLVTFELSFYKEKLEGLYHIQNIREFKKIENDVQTFEFFSKIKTRKKFLREIKKFGNDIIKEIERIPTSDPLTIRFKQDIKQTVTKISKSLK